MKTKTPWDFQKQLSVGQKGEELLLAKWPHRPVSRHTIFKGPDFVDVLGRVIELKTDTYPMDKTVNFFIERWSDAENLKPGGPWQAHLKGADVFVYLYINSGRWFVFDNIPALIHRVELLASTNVLKRLVDIPNRGYVTRGWKVPREHLKDLYKEEIL